MPKKQQPEAHRSLKQRVRIWLVDNEMTQEQLAPRLGISPSHLSDILNEKERPSLDVAAAFERVVGIPARDFAEVA